VVFAFPMDDIDGWSRWVGKIFVAPVQQANDHGHEAPALVGQDVMVARAFARLFVWFDGKNPALDQYAQPLRQQVARAIKHLQEVRKSGDAVQRFSKDQECPFLAHNLQGSSNRAIARVMTNALVHRVG
jgi:hypothetical protein